MANSAMIKAVSAGSLMLVTLMGSSGSVAQTGERTPSLTTIDEVIVTARRRQESQQVVPVAVTVLSGDFLEKNAISNITDLNGKVPSLRIENFNSPYNINVGIRAQRTANVAPGQDTAVGYYLDEVNYSYPVGISSQMFDLQAVEVLKGPQGTLFGRNTTGGALLLSTRRPDQEFGGQVRAGITSFSNGTGFNTLAVLNIPVSEQLAIRAGVNVIDRDPFIENKITQQDFDNYLIHPYVGSSKDDRMNDETISWRLSALWTPDDSVESLFTAMGSNIKTNGTAYSLLAVNPNGFASFGTGGRAVETFMTRQSDDFWSTREGHNAGNEMVTFSFSNVTSWDLSDSLTLKNILSWRKFDMNESLDLDGMPFQVLDVTYDIDGKEWTEELQLQGTSAQFDWTAGVFFSGQKMYERGTTLALAAFGSVPNLRDDDVNNSSMAAFAQGTYRLPAIEDLSITVGGRWTQDKREMQRRAWNNLQKSNCVLLGVDDATPLPAGSCVLDGKKTFSEFTYTTTIDYRIDDSAMVYAAHRKGYRSGGFDYTAPGVNFFQFDPEFVKDYELGFKKDWIFGEASLRTNLALYRQEYDDIQRFSAPVDNPNNFYVLNAAGATINGGEIEITFIPVEGLEISGFYSRINAEYDDFVTGAGDFTKNNFAQVPESQYSIRAAYTLPLNDSIGSFTISADYYRQDEIYWSDTAQGPGQGPDDSQKQSEYGILNMRLDWESVLRSNFDLALYVKNAQETEYNQFGVALYSSLGYNIATIGQPRIIGLEGIYRF